MKAEHVVSCLPRRVSHFLTADSRKKQRNLMVSHRGAGAYLQQSTGERQGKQSEPEISPDEMLSLIMSAEVIFAPSERGQRRNCQHSMISCVPAGTSCTCSPSAA
ncbi:hypothetical protein AMECASPLE_011574 [Ameca splendens]|uniref:Uncharacterized protein n=1 Tax=Ameca splendens TaxID=208324 RepID=A0ABV0YN97_9TELE